MSSIEQRAEEEAAIVSNHILAFPALYAQDIADTVDEPDVLLGRILLLCFSKCNSQEDVMRGLQELLNNEVNRFAAASAAQAHHTIMMTPGP